MASKKYYAVKKGKTTGVFESWDQCRDAVEGVSGAQYRGFASMEEALEYLGDSAAELTRDSNVTALRTGREEMYPTKVKADGKKDLPAEGELLVYVDGSYDDSIKKYAFGCVFLLPDGRIYTEYGNGNNEKSLQHRNVTGEMLGAMYAVKFAMNNNFQAVEIRYDYQGIESWVTGEWRSKTELTQKYAASMKEWGKGISIRFTKVAAHTNVTYNELADKMAKTGLTMGNGIPKIRKIEDMEEYHGTDETK